MIEQRMEELAARERELLETGKTDRDTVYELSQVRAERELLEIRKEQLRKESEEAERQKEFERRKARVEALAARAFEIVEERPQQVQQAREQIRTLLETAEPVLFAAYRLRVIKRIIGIECDHLGIDMPDLPGGLPIDARDRRVFFDLTNKMKQIDKDGERVNHHSARLAHIRPEKYESNVEHIISSFLG